MTNSHGYVLEYPRIRVDHFDQAPIPLPPSLLAHRRSLTAPGPACSNQDSDSLPFEAGQTHFDKPLLYLLTHIHTDHLKGLDRPGITAPIYCSAATKQLLLRYERQKTRIDKDRDAQAGSNVGVIRPYAHLRVTTDHAAARSKLSGFQTTTHDLLHPLPYNVPTKVPYTPTTTVMLTLIESNHMFGGTMFLIQGAHGAVLHTGDMRAEQWWCEALTRNPFLSPYLFWSTQNTDPGADERTGANHWADQIESFDSSATSSRANESFSQSQSDSQSGAGSQRLAGETSGPRRATRGVRRSALRLRNIYLDTELLLCNQHVPTKQLACLDMVALMRMYPSDTHFFLNCWTWGYEDMLVVTAKAFGCKIHVDRFKYIMYKAARTEAPFLADIVTQDATKTRFHACEKRDVCATVQALASRYSNDTDVALSREVRAAHSQMDSSSPDARQRWGPVRRQPAPLLVYVNPGQVEAERWQSMLQDTKQRLRAAQRNETAWPEALVVPIERHSTLPELQNFVSLFRPETVSPNTILDPKGGLDYYLLHHLFGHVLGGADDRKQLADQGLLMLGDKTWSFYEAQLARAREEALAQRDSGAGSTEAVRAASASLRTDGHAESISESLDANQLERLSRLRGISFKGLMMQNMAGNLAAMLEIERWRKAAGIQEASSELESARPESSADMLDRSDASLSSVGYDADHSQLAETQFALPSMSVSRQRPAAEAGNQGRGSAPRAAPVSSEPSRRVRRLGTRASTSPTAAPIEVDSGRPKDAAAVTVASGAAEVMAQSEASQSSVGEAVTELTEDLASRYLNVLIHHFGVPFDRTKPTHATHVQLWLSVRSKLPADAQKVEEHWFHETGTLPPLWSPSAAIQPSPAQPSNAIAAETQIHGAAGGDSGYAVREVLASFVDMFSTASSDSAAGVGVDTRGDGTIALHLVLRLFAQLGFHGVLGVAGESSHRHTQPHSHGSCAAEPSSQPWAPIAAPLTRLVQQLGRILEAVPTLVRGQTQEDAEGYLAGLQVAGVVLSYRPLNVIVPDSALQALLECIVTTVEAAPRDLNLLTPAAKKIVALAGAILRAEELDEAVLAAHEHRLLQLARDPDGTLRRLDGLLDSQSTSASAAREPVSETHGSSMLVRSPKIAAPEVGKELGKVGMGGRESIVDETSEDPIESSPSNLQLEHVGDESATQEEDSTQSESALSAPRTLPPRHIDRTTSLPSLHLPRTTRKRKATLDAPLRYRR